MAKKVLIIGGGFGGVRAALNLAGDTDFEVTLVSKLDYFEYHAALYRAATGRSPFETVINLNDFFTDDANVNVVNDEAIKLDSKKKIVEAKSGSKYQYDILILALGVITQYFGIKGLDKYSYGIKSIQEALEFKRHLHEDLINNKKAEHNYAIVGGGPTGIELAAELTSYIKRIRKCHHITTPYTIDLIEGGDRLLPAMPKRYGQMVTKRLKKLGIKLYLKTLVSAEKSEAIEFPHGHISTHTVAWTAGVATNPFFSDQGKLFKFGHNGKVEVDRQLQALPNVYVTGDCANTKYSGMAQTALYDANFVTDNLQRQAHDQKPIQYQEKKPVYVIPVGKGWAAVLWGKVELYGHLGWYLRRLIDLRLWLSFMAPGRATETWQAGFETSENCPQCDNS
jgi:NADH dehydrogenase